MILNKMKKQVNIVIDMNKTQEEVWQQMEEAYAVLHKLGQRKPWYKRLFSWF